MKMIKVFLALALVFVSCAANGAPKTTEKTLRMEQIENTFGLKLVCVMSDGKEWVYIKRAPERPAGVLAIVVPRNATDHDVTVATNASLYSALFIEEVNKRLSHETSVTYTSLNDPGSTQSP